MSNITKEAVKLFIKNNRYGVLATVRKDRTPDSAIMYYVPGKDLSVTLLTKDGTQKYKNIQENNNVLFSIVDEASLAYAQLRGEIELVEISQKELLQQIEEFSIVLNHKDFQVVLPILKHKDKGDFALLKLIPNEILYRSYLDNEKKEFYLKK